MANAKTALKANAKRRKVRLPPKETRIDKTKSPFLTGCNENLHMGWLAATSADSGKSRMGYFS